MMRLDQFVEFELYKEEMTEEIFNLIYSDGESWIGSTEAH
ncbi:hypothetical protein ACP4OV_005508 [Aristida adscensionis]